MTESFIPPSKLRRLLAAYIDYLLFGMLWETAVHIIAPGGVSVLYKFFGFFIFEAVLMWRMGSPGMYFLSIYAASQTIFSSDENDKISAMRLMVNPNIYSNEKWYTILIGVFIIISGCKEFIHWTVYTTPIPIFGFFPGAVMTAIINMIIGAIIIFAGYHILKLSKKGLYLTLLSGVIYIFSIIRGWGLWDEVVTQTMIERRALQGRTLTDTEIELVRMLFPEIYLISTILLMLTVILIARRLCL